MINIAISHEAALAFWVWAARPGSSAKTLAQATAAGSPGADLPRALIGGTNTLVSRRFLEALLAAPRRTLPASYKPLVTDCGAMGLLQLFDYDAQLDVLVERVASSRLTHAVKTHVMSNLSEASCFIEVTRGIYVASPELAAVQLSRTATLSQLVFLLNELCGSYSIDQDSDSGFYKRPPLVNLKVLSRMLETCKRAGNKRLCSRALNCTRPGAASPPEAQLAMLLSCPLIMGGAGFEPPVLNARVLDSERDRGVSGKLWRSCDLYWEAGKVAIEYDSEAFHSTRQQRENDSVRRNALQSAGIKVLSVTPGQLMTYAEYNRLCEALSRALRQRPRSRNLDYPAQRLQFYMDVTSHLPKWRRELLPPFSHGDGHTEEDESSACEQGPHCDDWELYPA